MIKYQSHAKNFQFKNIIAKIRFVKTPNGKEAIIKPIRILQFEKAKESQFEYSSVNLNFNTFPLPQNIYPVQYKIDKSYIHLLYDNKHMCIK